MRRIRSGLLFISVSAILTCCCKAYCPRESMSIAFVGFELKDIDSIVIYKYDNAAFSNPIDSSFTPRFGTEGDTIPFYFFDSDGFEMSKNYKVVMPNIERAFRISDLKFRKEECNCGQKDGKRVTGYVLDGQSFLEETVYLIK